MKLRRKGRGVLGLSRLGWDQLGFFCPRFFLGLSLQSCFLVNEAAALNIDRSYYFTFLKTQ